MVTIKFISCATGPAACYVTAQLLFLVSGSEMAACHCGLNSHTFQEKHLCCPSALRADKKYATRLTFIPSGYFLLGFFWLVLGHMCFNLSLKLGNRIAVFSYILAEISYVLF